MKKECVAMLLAGGQGSRLKALTSHVAKPAVPFGGKYRIIDFPLSNCVNSGIDTVGVLTQYQPLELNAYLGNGLPWDLDRLEGGLHVLPPYVVEGDAGTWYKGTANAIYQNLSFIERYDPEYVVLLSGDHIYKMDYSDMIKRHQEANAVCTIAVLEVTLEEATRFGIMTVDEDDIIRKFEEKPAHPQSTLASMGIYVFSWSKLREYLIADENDPNSSNDFGKNIIPNMLKAGETLAAYRFSGYWRDVGTIDSLWSANMDLLASGGGVNLFDDEWPIYARSPTRPPHLTGEKAVISHSMVTGGCIVEGTVENSVLFSSVTVGEGAVVRNSILMPGATVKAGATVEHAILAEDCIVGEGAVVGAVPTEGSSDLGIAVIAANMEVGEGAQVAPCAMVTQNIEAVNKEGM